MGLDFPTANDLEYIRERMKWAYWQGRMCDADVETLESWLKDTPSDEHWGSPDRVEVYAQREMLLLKTEREG